MERISLDPGRDLPQGEGRNVVDEDDEVGISHGDAITLKEAALRLDALRLAAGALSDLGNAHLHVRADDAVFIVEDEADPARA